MKLHFAHTFDPLIHRDQPWYGMTHNMYRGYTANFYSITSVISTLRRLLA